MKDTRYIAILEDEKDSSDTLNGYLMMFAKSKSVDLEVSRFFDAKSFFTAYVPGFDLIFLDIDLPDGNGMDIARQIRKDNNNSMIIFVTNLANYAIGGYEVDAFDFILKPLTYPSFFMKFERAYAVIEMNRAISINIKVGNEVRVFIIPLIKYIEVRDHYIYIHLVNETVCVTGRLTDFCAKLSGLPFVLCNQCYLVNMKYITGIQGETVMLGDESLRISRPRKKELLKAFTDYLGT